MKHILYYSKSERAEIRSQFNKSRGYCVVLDDNDKKRWQTGVLEPGEVCKWEDAKVFEVSEYRLVRDQFGRKMSSEPVPDIEPL